MSGWLNDRQRRFVLKETTINTVVVSAVLPTAAMALTMPLPLAFGGSNRFAALVMKNTLGMGMLITSPMTLGLQLRITAGRAPALNYVQATCTPIRLLPGMFLARAILYTALLFLVLVPCGLLAAHYFGIGRSGVGSFVAFNAVYCGLVGLLLTPAIDIGVMADGARADMRAADVATAAPGDASRPL